MIAGMRPGNPAGNVRATEYFVRIEPTAPARRRLSWTPERTTDVFYHILMDARFISRTQNLFEIIKTGDLTPRVAIDVIETSIQNEQESLLRVATQPDNRVLSSWDAVPGATKYELFRKLTGGSFKLINRQFEGAASFEFIDGPLEDGSFVYRLESTDDERDLTFDEETVVISTPPQRPTNISAIFTVATKIFRISWNASPSPDFKEYFVRHNSGTGPVRIDDAPEATTTNTFFEFDLTALTGDFEFLIRAVDNDDKEEQNLIMMVAISVINGVAQGLPANPEFVRAVPIAGGKAQISFTYFPSKETGFISGALAKEARIYFDNGTGTVDFVTPIGTILMNNPVAPARFSFDTAALANDTYLFAVRIATDVAGGGNETTNTDTHQATTNDNVPGATDLVVEIK